MNASTCRVLLSLAVVAVGFAGCTNENACIAAIHWHEETATREHLYGDEAVASWHDDKADAFRHAYAYSSDDVCRDWRAYRYYPGGSEPFDNLENPVPDHEFQDDDTFGVCAACGLSDNDHPRKTKERED